MGSVNTMSYDYLPVTAGAIDLGALKHSATRSAAEGTSSYSGGENDPFIVSVTEQNFQTEIIDQSTRVPVIVFLGSERSEASQEVRSMMAKLALNGHGQWMLADIDVDKHPQLAQAFGVQVLPTVIAIAAGQPIADFQGAYSDQELQRWIQAILTATQGRLSGPIEGVEDQPQVEEDPRLGAAMALVNEGNYQGAIEKLETIEQGDPLYAEAKTLRASLVVFKRAQEAEPGIIEKANAEPDDITMQMLAADVELFGADPAGAFNRLIDLIRRTSGAEREMVKKRLLELFDTVGADDPLVITARRQLSSALF